MSESSSSEINPAPSSKPKPSIQVENKGSMSGGQQVIEGDSGIQISGNVTNLTG